MRNEWLCTYRCGDAPSSTSPQTSSQFGERLAVKCAWESGCAAAWGAPHTFLGHGKTALRLFEWE